MNEATSGSCEDDREALGNVYGDSSFGQPPLNVADVNLQVAEEQRHLARRDYNGRVFRVEGELDVVQRRGHVIDLQAEEDRGDQRNLRHSISHAAKE
jgi:hypothetical protein